MNPLLLIVLLHPSQIDAVKSRLEGLGRIEFAYEGEFERWDDFNPRHPHERRYNYSGRMTVDGRSGKVAWEHHAPNREELQISKGSVSAKSATYTSQHKGSKTPITQSRLAGGYLAMTQVGGLRPIQWFPASGLLVANDDDAKRFVDFGEETKDGRRCQVIAHKLGAIDVAKFWVDLERNGVVLASEFHRQGVLINTLRTSDVTAHRAIDGRQVWLPLTAVLETRGKFDRKNLKFSPGPVWCRWTTRIVASTIRLDAQATKVEEVKFSPKAMIVDETMPAPAVKPVSANAPPKPVHKSATVNEVVQSITEADIQKAQLQATLRPPPVDWTQRIAWGLVVVGVLGAAFAWYRGMRAA